MTSKEFLVQLNEQEINVDAVSKVELKYKVCLPLLIKKMISFSKESIFLDNEWRTLSLEEVLDASDDLHIDFNELKILPLLDTGDNDFIVYLIEKNAWAKFNIVDECFFKSKLMLEDYF